jgi:hypothetical protein
MFQLITTYYKALEPEREAENIKCLLNNLSHPLIERVHLFLQTKDIPNVPENAKLHYIEHGIRPTFSELFEFGNKIGNNGAIKIVANSDIYFDETLKLASDALVRWDILALTRWDLKEDKSFEFYNNFKSQDVWIYKKQIKPNIGCYHIGRHGCDNRLVYEFKSKNYKIANPSLSIKTIHVHQSALRPYFDDPNYKFVSPPFDYLLPVCLGEKLKVPIKIYFLKSRYHYFKSQSNQTIPGIKFSIISRIWACILSKYYAQKIKLMN